ncbi:MAG: hypothetical protein ACXWW7_16075 [Nocardioides sp.]
MTMRPILGLLLALTLLLAGCGSETPEEQADDPTPAETTSSSPAPTPTNGPVDSDHVAVVSESDVGGKIAPVAVDLTDEAALADFVAQFEDGRMAAALEQAVAEADLAEGQTLVGAVVAIGCVPPKLVFLERTDAGLEMAAVPDKNAEHPQVECLVPVTSVGVAAVDESQA